MEKWEELLPAQETGRQTDFKHEEIFESPKAAHLAFRKAAERLLSINNWHIYAGAGSAKFTLCNNLGEELDGFAAAGLYLNIDLPAPGSDAGAGLEWVTIEQLITEGSHQTEDEYLLMTIRPVPAPKQTEAEIAHFYNDLSTNTLVVVRNGLKVYAGAHGRNETPNNEEVDLHDKIRNTVIALIARVGLSGPQWKKLVKGLITYETDGKEA
ncbi:hypothetical protein [Mucilaginibacter sp.]|uniref:hypothetical protein n=1 Tax=Mucilaginibacter sp. TaxID=1882438 RepID=UPI003D148D52